MGTQRLLLLAHIVLTAIVAVTLEHLLSSALGGVGALGFLNASLGGFEGWNGFTLLGFAGGGGLGLWTWKNPGVHQWSTEVVEELQRVTWPTWPETRVATGVVIATVLVGAVLLGAFDALWLKVTETVYSGS